MHHLPCRSLRPEDQRHPQGDHHRVLATGYLPFMPFKLYDIPEIRRGVARNLLESARHLPKPKGPTFLEVLGALRSACLDVDWSSARRPERVRERDIVLLGEEARDGLPIATNVQPQCCTKPLNCVV